MQTHFGIALQRGRCVGSQANECLHNFCFVSGHASEEILADTLFLQDVLNLDGPAIKLATQFSKGLCFWLPQTAACQR